MRGGLCKALISSSASLSPFDTNFSLDPASSRNHPANTSNLFFVPSEEVSFESPNENASNK